MRIPWNRPDQLSRRVEQLRSLPDLASARVIDLQRILRAGDETAIPAGELLLRGNDLPRWIYLVLSGHVVVSDGARVTHQAPGYWVGAVEATLRAPALATTVAGPGVTALAFTVPRFIALMEQAPSVALAMIRSASRSVVAGATSDVPVTTALAS